MSMILFYERINWENYPSVITPINEINLNKLDYAAKTLDERTVQLDTTKAEKETVLNTIQDWSMDEKTGIITITKVNGEQILFDLNVEKIPISFELSEDGILSMTTDDGTVFTANIAEMIPLITFNSTDTISVIVNGEGKNKTYSFEVKDGSITENKLQPNFLADVKTESEKAQVSSSSASESATSANTFAQQAKQYRDETEQIKNDVQSIVDVDIATTEKAGIVKPDGTTITVDTDGTIHSFGGSGGTKDYSELSNKPKINGVELSGNKTNSDLGINAESIGADVSGSASQALLDANSYTDEKVNEVVSNLPTELDSYEEIMANTQTKKSAGALGVKEGFEQINNSLTANSTQFYFDYQDGKYGFNTEPNRGADTFFPFKSVGSFKVVCGLLNNGYTPFDSYYVTSSDNTNYTALQDFDGIFTINIYMGTKPSGDRYCKVYINEVEVLSLGIDVSAESAGRKNITEVIPIKKGDVIRFTSTTSYFTSNVSCLVME